MDLADLDKMLDNIIKEMPAKKEKLLEGVGDILQKQVISNIESRVNTSSDKGEKAKLIQGVKQVIGSGKGYVAVKPDYEHSSLHHLVENGHRIVRNGVVVGYSNGVHAYRDSITQCEGQIMKLAENMVNEVVKDG